MQNIKTRSPSHHLFYRWYVVIPSHGLCVTFFTMFRTGPNSVEVILNPLLLVSQRLPKKVLYLDTWICWIHRVCFHLSGVCLHGSIHSHNLATWHSVDNQHFHIGTRVIFHCYVTWSEGKIGAPRARSQVFIGLLVLCAASLQPLGSHCCGWRWSNVRFGAKW